MNTYKDHYLVVSDNGKAWAVKAVPQGETLECLQTLVGGWGEYSDKCLIECAPNNTGIPTPGAAIIDCWVNESGLFRETFVKNWIATAFTGTELVGPAIFTSCNDEGETIPLPNGYILGAVQAGLELQGEGRSYMWQEVAMELMAQEQDVIALLSRMGNDDDSED